MEDNWSKALAFVLEQEGGNDDDPHDPGGRTSRGIIQREYDVYRRRQGKPPGDVWKASNDEIAQIYHQGYWSRVQADDLPSGVDLVMFDSAVNSGVGQAVKWLQRALGCAADGVFGAHTMTALIDDDDHQGIVTSICTQRLAMLQRLSTWKYFKHGWTARVEALATTARNMA